VPASTTGYRTNGVVLSHQNTSRGSSRIKQTKDQTGRAHLSPCWVHSGRAWWVGCREAAPLCSLTVGCNLEHQFGGCMLPFLCVAASRTEYFTHTRPPSTQTAKPTEQPEKKREKTDTHNTLEHMAGAQQLSKMGWL